jgi:hypothetical protein
VDCFISFSFYDFRDSPIAAYYHRLRIAFSFAVLEARSPCYVVASHGCLGLLRRLIALHGFAG